MKQLHIVSAFLICCSSRKKKSNEKCTFFKDCDILGLLEIAGKHVPLKYFVLNDDVF